MKIQIFNPENDMALADGTPGYTPPANIRAYRKANWRMPQQWAEPGDIVWDGETEFRNLGIPESQDFEICPWGWSKALVHQLQLAGFPCEKMPTMEYLDKLRTLSSRVSTVKVQQQLGIDAHVCRTFEDVKSLLFGSHPSPPEVSVPWEGNRNGEMVVKFILKSPWSSSGKGLMFTDNPNWQGWVRRILHLQGAVIIEPLLDRRQDFAMEFYVKEGRAEYLGLSVFNTDEHGHYLSNVIDTEEKKLDLLFSDGSGMYRKSFGNPLGTFLAIKKWYLDNLPTIAPWYTGPVGVDMLITRDGQICPCIEINWRMTMGMVSVIKVCL